MTTSKMRIAIRHLSGSKVNQIEQFDLEGLQEITIGREPSSRIAYDLQRDDEVSRKHAVIRVKKRRRTLLSDFDQMNAKRHYAGHQDFVVRQLDLLPQLPFVLVPRSGCLDEIG